MPHRPYPFFLILFAWIALCTQAAETSSSSLSNASTHLDLQVQLLGSFAESTVAHARTAGVDLRGRYQRSWLNRFTVRAEGEVWLEEGAHHSMFSDEFRPRQQVRVREAILTWEPIPTLALDAGVLDQESRDQELVFGRVSFPGLRERWRFEISGLRGRFEMRQTVVSQTSIPPLTQGTFEATASFFREQLSLGQDSTPLSWNAYLGHHHFTALNQMTAFQSRFLGNTVSGIGIGQSQFDYGFGVVDAGLDVAYRIANVTPSLHLQSLWNHEAPVQKNRGYLARLQVQLDLDPDLRLVPSLEWFQLESDVTPAALAPRRFGRTNRVGWGVSLMAEFPRSRFRAGIEFVPSSPIIASAHQADLYWAQAFLQTDFGSL